ncbi:MAG: 50S ribosomal protein L11 methyltransferase, partial [Ginsengibacter sp.]
EKIDFRNKSVLDFGTGTGILAILAEKLGADEIVAIDNDEWSITNAMENREANNCNNIKIELKDAPEAVMHFDIILANINLNILSNSATSISSILVGNGCLLLSGFLEKDEPEIINIFERRNIRKLKKLHRNGWIAIYLKKHSE